MRSSTDRMHLVAMVNPPTSQYAENWRHPLSRQDWLSAEFYVDLARTLERGCFDMLFLPDALAVPEDHAGNYGTMLQVGSATVKRALKKAADDRAAACIEFVLRRAREREGCIDVPD